MKLATLRNAHPDGQLVVVTRNLDRFVSAGRIAPNLQAALDDWDNAEPRLQALSAELNAGEISGEKFDPQLAMAPLPRAYQWIDGSGYMAHLERIRDLNGSRDQELQNVRPLLYQGASDSLAAATDQMVIPSDDLAADYEAELAVILGPVPMGADAQTALDAVRLFTICNDTSLRRLVANDLQNGFGFFHSKPATSFAPIVATADEFPEQWVNGRLSLSLRVEVNEQVYGQLNTGVDMHFSFGDMISEATRTRTLAAGTIFGGGTVCNRHDEMLPLKKNGIGFACIAEARTVERSKLGKPRTPFLKPGDRLRIGAYDPEGRNVFGSIDQKVVIHAD